MDVFRYMKTLRSYLAITVRLIRLPGFFAFGIKNIKT
jgi:predicted TPR repeat methyltransferase